MALIDMSETYQMTNDGAHIDGTDVYQSNRNLLDNAYFVGGGSQLGDGIFPINQRGQTAYTGANAHTFDRWKQQYNTNTQLLSNGIRVYGDWDINQTVLENLPTGEPYTLSVKYSNLSGTDGLHLFAYNASLQTITEVWTHDASGIFTCTFTPQTQIKTIALGYRGSGDGDVVIQAVKLEKGTVSTLANDTPPDFGEELRKCRRYLQYVPLTRTTAVIAGSAAVVTLNGVEMATVPTPALISAGGARDAGGMQSIISATVTGFTYNTPTVQFALAGNLNYVIGYVYDTVLQLSCEL